MRLRFTKMQGAGNDFVVIDGVRQRVDLTPAQWRLLGDRHFGVGADQMLLVEASDRPGIDFRYRIFNADGGEVEQCGNGARCFVRFVRDQGLTDKRVIRVSTAGGVIEPAIEDDGRVRVDMGEPVFDPVRVPFDDQGLEPRIEDRQPMYALEIDGATRWFAMVSMGNPHAVQEVADVGAAPVLREGTLIENHPRFPNRVNAGFMQVLDRGNIALRVFERGVGETLACGTGACAAVVAGIRRGKLDSPADVRTRGGILTISWDGATVGMTGPAVSVFEGSIEIAE